jgi:hypothetical protein
MTPSIPLYRKMVIVKRLVPEFSESLCPCEISPKGWSVCGAKRAQPVATGRKWEQPKSGSNRRIGNRWQPTATVSERMVKVDVCHRLRPAAMTLFLLGRGSTSCLRKEIESSEPEGPQDPM